MTPQPFVILNGTYASLCCLKLDLYGLFIDHISFQLGEPPVTSVPGLPACNPHGDPPVYGDCWYNCTLEDISEEDKKHRLRKVLFLT